MVFSIVATTWETISFDLLEERTEGEVDLATKDLFTPSLASLGLCMDFYDPTELSSTCGT